MEVDLGQLSLRVAVDMFTFPRTLRSPKPSSQIGQAAPEAQPLAPPRSVRNPFPPLFPLHVEFPRAHPTTPIDGGDLPSRSLCWRCPTDETRVAQFAECKPSAESHIKCLIDDLLGTPQRVRASYCTGSMVFVGCGG